VTKLPGTCFTRSKFCAN